MSGTKPRNKISDNASMEELLRAVQERYGEVPLIARVLGEHRPEILAAGMEKSFRLMREGALEPRVAELVALAAAVALRCPPCALSHMRRALASGANRQEVLDAVLIASHVAETSSLAVGLRKFLEASAAEEECALGCGVERRDE
ncbi:carboxymuconolactone decarboxylase family protein [Candidatus Pyrohabitans sp.]